MHAPRLIAAGMIAGVAATLTLGFAQTDDTPAPTPVSSPTATPTPAPAAGPVMEDAPVGSPAPAPSVDPSAIPAPVIEDSPVATPVIDEDSPLWDCRVMGNNACGVEVEGTWYVITFVEGQPSTVTVR